MKKILSILAAIGLTATTAGSVVSCGNTANKKASNNKEKTPKKDGSNKNKTVLNISSNDFDNAYSTWDKTNNSYIKSFLINNFALEVNELQQQKIKPAKELININHLNGEGSPTLSILNDDNDLTGKIFQSLNNKLYVWGLIKENQKFDASKLSIKFTDIRSKKSGETDYNAPTGANCWTASVSYTGSKNSFILNGWFTPQLNNFKTVDSITNENYKSVFDQAKAYDATTPKTINGPGYFIPLNFEGDKDSDGLLKQGITYKISNTEANTKVISYLTMYLKSLGIVSLTYDPLLTNFNFSFLPNVDKDGYSEVTTKDINSPRSWVKPATVSWAQDQSVSFNLVGSVLIEGYQY